MILQALYDYYQRKAAIGSPDAAPRGFQWKDLPYIIVIDREGRFVRIEDTQEKFGKRLRGKAYLVPLAPIRAGAVVRAGLLWDQLEYAVGANPRGRIDTAERFASFRHRIEEELGGIRHPSLEALRIFLGNEPAQRIAERVSFDDWSRVQAANPFISFRVEGERTLPEVLFDELRDLNASGGLASDTDRFCPVSGGRGPVPSTHSKIKGVWGAQSSGAALVSFNLQAFESYGKEQNTNAQMSEAAAEAYTKALTMLLAEGSSNRMQVGDSSVVFWAQKDESVFEVHFKSFFALPPKDDPDKGAGAVLNAFRSVLTGLPPVETSARFYVLGLAPNASRLAVRFWHEGTVGDFASNLLSHFNDLELVAPKTDAGIAALGYLLASTALDWKSENVPPNLAGAMMRSIMTGTPYPPMLSQQCIRRIRAEQGGVNRPRAALLKACINRNLRRTNPYGEKEMTVALDPDNINQGYRLGRLFAVLEKIQEDANPGLNATIRDRFYGAASSSPVSVFPQLLKLKNHHLSKLDNPAFRVAHERRLTEIIGGLGADMPGHLTMEDQARFAVGYYHQRQALFTSGKAIGTDTTTKEA